MLLKSGNSSELNLNLSHLPRALGILFALGATAAFGQVQPDAGSLLTTPAAPAVAAPAKSPSFDVQQDIRPALVAPGGVKVKAASFKITGNTVFSEAELAGLLAGLVGQELDLAGLDGAASTISQYYRSHGYFVARAYLPAQEVASGNLEIAVIEGRLGAVKLTRAGETRLDESRAAALVAGAAPMGAPINEQNIERGLMLLNDLPGVEVKSTLVPGATPGTSDLVVETTEGKLITGSVDLDNFGNKYSGEYRAGASVNFNDLSGMGDLLTVRGMTGGEGMGYGRVAYSLPVGDMGTKLGVAYSRMNYKLGGDFAALNASGDSSVTSLYAVHPLVRSRNSNVYVTGTYDNKRLQDRQKLTATSNEVTDKLVDAYGIGFSGDMRDGMGGGGLTAAGLAFSGGSLGLGGNSNYAANDALTAKTSGNYSKVSYNLSRLQRLDNDWSFFAAFSGQDASKNLDSSEKFVLGGMGVRAYPQGEAAGDAGNLLNLEARFNVAGFQFGSLQIIGFIDYGTITLHKTTWAGWQPVGVPNFPNTYSIAGAGVGVNLYKEGDYFIRTSLAAKLGDNPGRDKAGRDSDSENRGVRLWLQASKQF